MEYVFYACDDHINYVIEDFINLYGITPDFDFNKDMERNYCNYCLEYGKYVLIFSEK